MHSIGSFGLPHRIARPIGSTSLAALALVLAHAGTSWGATWPTARTTPSITQLVAVDATGALRWPYGREDLSGDGDVFLPAEQSIDLRTVYATTGDKRFWVRAYVANQNAVSQTAVVYVFLDADQTATTGGSTKAAEVDPGLSDYRLTTGYEHIIGIRANGTVLGVWDWSAGQSRYVPAQVTPAHASAEAGRDIDPIFLSGLLHGYVQASVDFSLVGFSETCSAYLDVRLVDGTALDDAMGETAPCIPIDRESDHVPDIVIPQSGCVADVQCPAGGRCVNGICVVLASCTADTDCAGGTHCVDHACVGVACNLDTECAAGTHCVDHGCVTIVACNADTECTGTWGTHCVDHICVGVASCSADTECAGGTRCVDHVCVAVTASCNADTECPSGNRCVNHACVVATTCSSDAQCPATDRCVSSRCVPRDGSSCTSNDVCGDLVCKNGVCTACSSSGNECGDGRRCTSDGRCVEAVVLAQGEKIEGGAFHCSVGRARGDARPYVAVHALWILAPLWRRRCRKLRQRSAELHARTKEER